LGVTNQNRIFGPDSAGRIREDRHHPMLMESNEHPALCIVSALHLLVLWGYRIIESAFRVIPGAFSDGIRLAEDSLGSAGSQVCALSM
jgi:hypothetical protein